MAPCLEQLEEVCRTATREAKFLDASHRAKQPIYAHTICVGEAHVGEEEVARRRKGEKRTREHLGKEWRTPDPLEDASM